MADCSYLVEVIADGENLGKVQFISYFDTVKDVVGRNLWMIRM